ncbi:unnamed protein product [Lymnaea stagnalis]|uniref:Connective tissue growth factor n=1 Tax=Lymnaea stagnalis TaxID=6523 RepID=A0AAV2I9Y5_LYMST
MPRRQLTFCDVTMVARINVYRGCQLAVIAAVSVLLAAHEQAEVNSPCLGCRLFNLVNRNNPDDKKDSGFCQYPCQCPHEELICEEGVTRVKDGCSCCYMCARQMGDLCSKKDRCDTAKGLVCDNKNDNSTGICRGKDKNPCIVGAVVFKDGEKFQPQCSLMCTCQNGFYGCVNTCPHELQRPSEQTCREPKLVKVNNKCCREWTCEKMVSLVSSGHRGLESQNLMNPKYLRHSTDSPSSTTPLPAATYSRPCQGEETDWSQCSVTCGVGVSMRIVVDKYTCQRFPETQLCYFRPCNVNLSTAVRLGPAKCTPTTRSTGRQHIHFQGCTSVRDYKLKFCTNCKKKKCCYPMRTKSKDMEFECSGKREMMKFLWVKKCRCDDQCYVRDQRRSQSDSRRYSHAWRNRRNKRFQK